MSFYCILLYHISSSDVSSMGKVFNHEMANLGENIWNHPMRVVKICNWTAFQDGFGEHTSNHGPKVPVPRNQYTASAFYLTLFDAKIIKSKLVEALNKIERAIDNNPPPIWTTHHDISTIFFAINRPISQVHEPKSWIYLVYVKCFFPFIWVNFGLIWATVGLFVIFVSLWPLWAIPRLLWSFLAWF